LQRKGDSVELSNETQSYRPGDVVYVFYRNPHTQDVANVQSAAVVNNPEKPEELALFMYETYYPLSNETAVYASAAEAEQAYNYYFGNVSEGTLE
jgi:transcriptional regulator of the spore photoproduct lyase operon